VAKASQLLSLARITGWFMTVIVVFKPDDVVLADVLALGDLDNDERYVAGVLEAVLCA